MDLTYHSKGPQNLLEMWPLLTSWHPKAHLTVLAFPSSILPWPPWDASLGRGWRVSRHSWWQEHRHCVQVTGSHGSGLRKLAASLLPISPVQQRPLLEETSSSILWYPELILWVILVPTCPHGQQWPRNLAVRVYGGRYLAQWHL